MKKMVQRRHVFAAALAAAMMFAAGIGAYAAPSAVYNPDAKTISITGVEENASKASLIVFSPKYNLSTFAGVEYFDVQDLAGDGSFSFSVPELSAENMAIGDYLCRVDVFGGNETRKYTLDVYYPWAASDMTKLRRFDYSIAEDTISATAWFSDTYQLNPNYRVFIGLYKEGRLIGVAMADKPGSASSATGWEAPLTATVAKNQEADKMKAYLMDVSNLQPQVACIEVPLGNSANQL